MPVAAHAAAPPIVPPTSVLDGAVHDIAVDGDQTYIAGAFRSQRQVTGGGILTSASGTGQPDTAKLPPVAGKIKAAVPDGSGGWFVGGEFTAIGSAARTNLAHVLADGTVAAFNPAPVGQGLGSSVGEGVDALTLSGNTLYVGGRFTFIASTLRKGLAAVDATTGAIKSFAPEPNGAVTSLLLDGATLYAAGPFSSIGGQSRNNVAAVDASTGSATGFSADVSTSLMLAPGTPVVQSLAKAGSTLFIGGYLTSAGGSARSRLAGVNASTGAVTSFDAQLASASLIGTATVNSLAASGSTLYVGGEFTSIGGQARSDLAALSTTTGLTTSWNPSLTQSFGDQQHITQVATDGTTVYVSGAFHQGGGQDRAGLAAFSASTGNVTSWNPNVANPGIDSCCGGTSTTGTVGSLTVGSGQVVVGGAFAGAGPATVTRPYLARLLPSGAIDPTWTPTVPEQATKLAIGPGAVYAYSFGRVRAFNKTSGAATSFSAGGDPMDVVDLEFAGGKVYAAGACCAAGRHLFEFDGTTGALASWNPALAPTFPNPVSDIETADGQLYAAGSFTSVGGTSRNGLAAFNLGTHALLPFGSSAPSASGGSMTTRGNTLYVGRKAFDRTTGNVLPWDPTGGNPFAGIANLSTGPDGIYGFRSSGVVNNVVRLDPTSGTAEILFPSPRGILGATPKALDATKDLLIGGDMIAVGTTVTGPLARFDLPDASPEKPANTTAPSIAGGATVGSTLTCSPGVWTGSPSFGFEWLRAGAPIGGATAATYMVSDADAGQTITCRVTASNAGGSSATSSTALSIPSTAPPLETPVDPPKLTEAPTIEPVSVPAPQPRPAPGGPQVSGADDPVITVPKTIRLSVLKRGLTIKVSGLKAGSVVKAELRVGKTMLARATRKAGKTGVASIRLKPGATKLTKVRKGTKLTVAASGLRADGRRKSVSAASRVG